MAEFDLGDCSGQLSWLDEWINEPQVWDAQMGYNADWDDDYDLLNDPTISGNGVDELPSLPSSCYLNSTTISDTSEPATTHQQEQPFFNDNPVKSQNLWTSLHCDRTTASSPSASHTSKRPNQKVQLQREDKKERSRLASARSRKKKKEMFAALQVDREEKAKKASKLEARKDELEVENRRLRQFLADTA